MNALAMIGEFFAFFVELFQAILSGFTGLLGDAGEGDDAAAE